MKYLWIPLFCVCLVGCGAKAHSPFASTLTLYSEVKGPIGATEHEIPDSYAIGSATAQSILGLIEIGDASINTAARNGGITKIYYVDYESTSILGLFATYTVLVYGERGRNPLTPIVTTRGNQLKLAKVKLSNLEELNLESEDISDLTGLQHATKLQTLNLNDNLIEDVSPLAKLTNLHTLGLASNAIEDVSPLAGLTNLHTLGLASNAIEDVSPLAGLTNLQALFLTENAIEDVSPLAGLTKLGTLDLRGNAIEDVSPLAKLTSLRTLFLTENAIEDVSPLAKLTNLHILVLRDNPLSDESIAVHIPAIRANGTAVTIK